MSKTTKTKKAKKPVCKECHDRETEHRLAVWCEQQRKDYKAGKLTAYQIKKLEEIPGWYW